MSDRFGNDSVPRLMRLVARKLEDYVEGDELALETLGEAIEEQGFSAEDLHSVILALRSLAGAGPQSGWVAGTPDHLTQRVLSAEERETLSTEAWGYLIDLKAKGSLDADQFERVIEMLTGCGQRPVSVELARDVAARVALEVDEGGGELPHGEHEVAH